jgi:hypothetical protein
LAATSYMLARNAKRPAGCAARYHGHQPFAAAPVLGEAYACCHVLRGVNLIRVLGILSLSLLTGEEKVAEGGGAREGGC